MKTIHHNSRSFRIPFNIEPGERAKIKEVLLVVSEDLGKTWEAVSKTTPDQPALAFMARRDGEYWFAVQTRNVQGRLFPPVTAEIEPRMIVVVDTLSPEVRIEPNGRRGSLASARWEVRDAHLDLTTLVLEYQAEGARDWRRVPIRKRSLIGLETWDAGTAEPLRARVSVSDLAGNRQEAIEMLPDGTPGLPAGLNDDADHAATAPPPSLGGSFASNVVEALPRMTSDPRPAAVNAPPPDPFGPSPAVPGAPPRQELQGTGPILAGSPRFALQYAVDDAGPDGPATVELWVTQDGGRTWSRKGDDPDRASPFNVDLGGEGTFGIRLVARSAFNQGDDPPAPGDPPQALVEVDSSPPVVKLDPVLVGTGPNLGKVTIAWHASDLHLGPKPVVISVRADTPTAVWKPIAPPIENSGRYVWTLPPSTPPKFHVRVEVIDTLGNRSAVDTADGGPVIVDRSRPKSRILKVEPSALNGPNGSWR